MVDKASNSSSVDYLIQYKRMTGCITTKNNAKANFNKINLTQKKLRTSKQVITAQHLQAKFLAKFNNQKLPATNEKQTISVSRDSQKIAAKNKKKILNMKHLDVGARKVGNDKRSYFNINPSYFNSMREHNLSVFKVPELPLSKKQFKNPVPPPSETLSINSLTSSMFKPKPSKTSTPIERPKPFFSDPGDLPCLIKSYVEYTSQKELDEVPFEIKANIFLKRVDNAAQKMDLKGFSDIEDPLIEIKSRISEIYKVSSRFPRLINETLMSNSVLNQNELKIATIDSLEYLSFPKSQKKSLPIPEFYEEVERNTKSGTQFNFCNTKDIFNWTAKSGTLSDFKQPNDFFQVKSSENSLNPFFSPEPSKKLYITPSRTRADDLLFNTPEDVFSEAMQVEHVHDYDGFSFTPSDFGKHWKMPNLGCLDSTAAVFKSPPDSRVTHSISRSRQSQRKSQKSNLEQHANSSLTTFQWTPNVGNFVFIDEMTCSPSRFFYEPRKLF